MWDNKFMNKKEFTETKDFLKDYVDLKPIQTIILIFFFVMLTDGTVGCLSRKELK